VEGCDAALGPHGPEPLDGAARALVLEEAREMAARALRVLAVARKAGGDGPGAERGMELLGLAGMLDAPRVEAKGAIRTCHDAGVRPIMITGDHPVTARAVAEELDLLGGGDVVTGPELGAMDDATLARRAPAIQVYARVSPADKLRVVTALQAAGAVVAMTGDGVNDAPALKKADVGVAMGITGTDVSKEAAAMILTDDDFASIVAAVEEGRAIFDNVKKYLMYLLSSNVGEIALMAGALLVGLPVPLTAVQILYVNLATDGLPALALAFDPHAGDLMRRRPRDPREGIFTPAVVKVMLTGGLWSGVVNVSLFAWSLASGRPLDEAMTMTFVSLVLIQFFKAYAFRSERHSVLERPFENRWLNLAVGWELVLLAVIVYWPPLHDAFRTYALTAEDALIVLGAAATVLPVVETAKWLERRAERGRAA
jgi:Ca2+-transporting ATPase